MNLKICTSCGRPLENAEDFAPGDASPDYCSNCTDAEGRLLPFTTILARTINNLEESDGLTRGEAFRKAREILKNRPMWAKLVKHFSSI